MSGKLRLAFSVAVVLVFAIPASTQKPYAVLKIPLERCDLLPVVPIRAEGRPA